MYDVVPQSSAATAALVLQSILLAAAIALLGPIGGALFGDPRAGLAASAVALTYAPLAFHSLKLLPIAIALATQALALGLLLRLRAKVTVPRCAAAGLAIGVACLARARVPVVRPLALLSCGPFVGASYRCSFSSPVWSWPLPPSPCTTPGTVSSR